MPFDDEVRGNRSQNDTIVDKEENRSDPEEDPRGKTTERNTYIIHNVETRHARAVPRAQAGF